MSPRSTLALALAGSVALLAPAARADDVPVGLSVSIERVAGFAYGSARPTTSTSSLGATTFGVAGPAINPIALPRAGGDVLLPVGLTLGGALGYGHASLSSTDNGQGGAFSGNAWLLSPRVGYLLRLGPLVDLWPRAGVTLAGASLQNPDGQSCSSTFVAPGAVPTTACTAVPGDSESLFVAAASVDVAVALRLTRTFNLLGGVAYDHVFAASGSTTSRGNGSVDAHADGQYLGAQVWLGLGGYVL